MAGSRPSFFASTLMTSPRPAPCKCFALVASSLTRVKVIFKMPCIQQVRTPTQGIRADAAVNSGNTLAAWAELLPQAEAIEILSSAKQAYETALTEEQDAAVCCLLHCKHEHFTGNTPSLETLLSPDSIF